MYGNLDALDDAPAQPPLEPVGPAPMRGLARLFRLLMQSPRLVVLALLLLGALGLLASRLYRLQVVEAQYWANRSEQQRARLVRLPAPRGLIYSRDGEPLVRNAPAFQVVVIPALLPEDEQEYARVLQRLATLLNRSYIEIRTLVEEAAPYESLPIARLVDRNTALVIAEEGLTLPGVQVEALPRRQYLYGALVSQVVGYLGPIPEGEEETYLAEGYDTSSDQVGYDSIEYAFEEELRGVAGERYQEEDVLGRVIRVLGQEVPPVAGRSIHLTLDLELQQVVQDALVRGMERVNSPRGVAIVMDPRTGEVLAMVSLPTYDNNLFAQGISATAYRRLLEDPHRPLVNHAIADYLPPGSIFKIVPAAAALEEGVISEDTRINCPGTIVIPDRYYPNDPGRAHRFYCWRRAGHGWLDIIGGLANSCDVFFYEVGGGFEETGFEGLGPERLAAYARLFGLGSLTGIELPQEVPGLVPDPTWKRLNYGENWSTGDTYNLAIGQGFLQVTPLQMLNIMAATANGGTLYRPQIVHHITDVDGNVVRPFRPEIIRTLPISSTYWTLIQQGLEGAVAYGTATGAQVPGVRIAGKTGTAQFCDDIAREMGICAEGLAQPTHAWFMAFAPVEAPEIALIVFIYNGGEGSSVAVPVAQDILEWYFQDRQP